MWRTGSSTAGPSQQSDQQVRVYGLRRRLSGQLSVIPMGVAQCCGSGMFIPDPDFYPSRISDRESRIPDLGSRIPDPKTATKERVEKKFVVIPLLVATNFKKIKIS